MIGLTIGAITSLALMLHAGHRQRSIILVLLFAAWVLSPFFGLVYAHLSSKRWFTICPRSVVCPHAFSCLRVSRHLCRCCVWAHDFEDGFRFPGHSFCVLVTDWISRLLRVALVSQSVATRRRKPKDIILPARMIDGLVCLTPSRNLAFAQVQPVDVLFQLLYCREVTRNGCAR